MNPPTPNPLQLLEPRSPEALLPQASAWPWLVACAVLIAILAACWVLLRRRESSDPSERLRSAYERARLDLESADPRHPRDAAIHGSLVLRRYLVAATGDPSLYETHEEFIARHDALQMLDAQTRDAAVCGFARFAAFKYAPEPPDADPTGILAEARTLLETLHQRAAP
ncbi:MAG: DUF4381 domain-containing protein [Verrucomicrobia bacterium]|nr:DUF4381 domain-containing protein [Verrucomicrobiota bacterium]